MTNIPYKYNSDSYKMLGCQMMDSVLSQCVLYTFATHDFRSCPMDSFALCGWREVKQAVMSGFQIRHRCDRKGDDLSLSIYRVKRGSAFWQIWRTKWRLESSFKVRDAQWLWEHWCLEEDKIALTMFIQRQRLEGNLGGYRRTHCHAETIFSIM